MDVGVDVGPGDDPGRGGDLGEVDAEILGVLANRGLGEHRRARGGRERSDDRRELGEHPGVTPHFRGVGGDQAAHVRRRRLLDVAALLVRRASDGAGQLVLAARATDGFGLLDAVTDEHRRAAG
ncbi:MAG: hypothetical protein BWY91_02808 [bacterium ADurb.BinA028]|nr:MAG: hypothetical protein BWY91_02808 [bacterium ADurb.BinA028]